MQFGHLKRRKFLTLLGGAATAWPHMARTQQPMPVLGILNSGGTNPYAVMNKALVRGITEAGFVEGRNFSVIERFGNGQFDRLPELAAELVRMPVALLAVPAGDTPALVAKQATSTIPVVFIVGGDPVQSGLVASLNRPGGNLTGITIFTLVLAEKRLELLRDLVPKGRLFGVLINPANVSAQNDTRVQTEAGRRLGLDITVQLASTADDIDRVFAAFAEQKVAAVLVNGDPYFLNRRVQLAALAARYSLPATYALREHAVAGGLISYGTDLTQAYHQVGVLAGRILKGEKPANIPVEQPTKFQLVVNLKTAKALGIDVPESITVRADEVIE
jgi:putative tryptophan/tyrosine transport system substrate-binding protein